jgi:integrase/recombinase XerD
MNGAPDIAQLFDGTGRRKYLCESELTRFHKALRKADHPTRIFCQLIALSGCRISEALATTPRNLDADAKRVIFRTLKRRRTAFRAVPVPDALMRDLAFLAKGLGSEDRLWPWSRQTGWRKVRAVMEAAEITGPMAMPKGLRHAYGIRAAGENVPSNLIQRWLGHADPDTTSIYINAIGNEERKFAERMWKTVAPTKL